MTVERFRLIEFWVITALSFLLLSFSLANGYLHFSRIWFRIDTFEQQRIYLNYNWALNGLWPITSLFLTFYGCWYALNRIVFPRYWPQNHNYLLIGWALMGLILLTGVWSFLYFWEELNFRQDVHAHIIGAKRGSLFRFKNLALLSTSLLFLLSFYTILSQAYQWAIQQPENETNPQIIKDGSRLALIGFTILITFQLLNQSAFFIPSSIWVQGAFIHAYLYHHHLLQLKNVSFWRSLNNKSALPKIFNVLLVSLGTSIAFCFIYEATKIHHYYLFGFLRGEEIFVFWLFSWLGAIAVTLVRQLMVKPLEINLNRNQAELSALQAQINPHFMFNAMNTLYATAIAEKAEKTSQGIQQLSDMMRFMMHENNQDQIDVQQEVSYLRNYIDLQRLRMTESDKLELKIDLDDSLCLRSIAPMLLIPFVENAFKHGVSLRQQSWIYVKLDCQQEKLQFSVFNSLHLHHENDPEKHSSGIGLVNVQKRLELLYPKNHTLQIHRTEKEFSVNLAIDFAKKSQKTILNSVLTTFDPH